MSGRVWSLICVPVLASGAMLAATRAAGVDLPTGTTTVPVTAAQTTPNIDATLSSAGSIGGVVRGTDGHAVRDVLVSLFASDGRVINGTATRRSGKYVISPVPASSEG